MRLPSALVDSPPQNHDEGTVWHRITGGRRGKQDSAARGAEAREALTEVVEAADRQGQLRSIIEALTADLVEEDFSPRWSYEREDLRRKLYRKPTTMKISFAGLDDTIPVHGPDSVLHQNPLWEDFLALLNKKSCRSFAKDMGRQRQESGKSDYNPGIPWKAAPVETQGATCNRRVSAFRNR